MSVSSTDPVDTVIGILEAAADTDWPNDTPPDRIQRAEASQPSEALRDTRRSDVSMYVYSPVVGDLTKYDAEGTTIDQTEIARTEIYTVDAATTNSYLSAAISIIADYTNDNQTTTAWADIWPEENEDFSAQNFQLANGFAINGLNTRLRRAADA